MIFASGQGAGAVRTLDLPGGSFFGLYLVQNGTTRAFLARNPGNQLPRRPLTFFSFAEANPDRFDHLRRLSDNRFAFEDMTRGGDRDFDDLVAHFRFDRPASGPEGDPPVITAALSNDTARGGATNADRITSDPSVPGTVADASRVTRFRAGFDCTPASAFTDVLSDLGPGGRFAFNRARVNQINGAPLPNGAHVLHLQAADEHGNTSPVFDVSFTLDTTPPAISFDLAPASDTEPAGDQRTTFATVTLAGQTGPGVPLVLQPGGAATTSTASGGITFPGVGLAIGSNPFTVRGSDLAGNEGTAARTVTRLEVPTAPVACGFEDGLSGWDVAERDGSGAGRGSVAAQAGRAVLREGDSFNVTLSRRLTVPPAPSTLVFRFEDLAFDTTDPAFINDAFEAALVDAEGRSLVHTIGTGRDAFFNITEGVPAAAGTGTTVDGQNVTVDISGLIPGSTGTLIFRLVNNDSDTNTSVGVTCVQLQNGNVRQAAFTPAGPTKFFVVDDQADTMFRYGRSGSAAGLFTLDAGVANPRGIAANAAGDTLWVIDGATKQVTVYSGDGTRRGTWTPAGLQSPQDIATNGTDIWIVDTGLRQVLRYAGAASLTTGSAPAVATFALHADNTSPSGIVTDGSTLWVTDDGRDEVFVYSAAGTLLGRWQLDAGNQDASGITRNPSDGNDLWVVDRANARVYHYAGAMTRRDGIQSASSVFSLAGANRQPEGIADPPCEFVSLLGEQDYADGAIVSSNPVWLAAQANEPPPFNALQVAPTTIRWTHAAIPLAGPATLTVSLWDLDNDQPGPQVTSLTFNGVPQSVEVFETPPVASDVIRFYTLPVDEGLFSGGSLAVALTISGPPTGNEVGIDFSRLVVTQRPDIAPTHLAWNAGAGGVDFRYEISACDLLQDTSVGLYWTRGTTFLDRRGSRPVERPGWETCQEQRGQERRPGSCGRGRRRRHAGRRSGRHGRQATRLDQEPARRWPRPGKRRSHH